MTRIHFILAGLAALLLVVLFWLLLWSPQQDELASLSDEIEAEHDQQRLLAAELERLRTVRDEAPNVEAELAAAAAVLPRDPALPAALRQLQLAADESGASLRAVSPARPVQVEGADVGVSSIALTVQLEGAYFQLVDFLRRIEDPTISPRGVVWQEASIAPEDHPTLNATMAGVMFTRLPGPPDEPPEGDEDAQVDDEDDDEAATEDADVTVEVEE